MKKGRHARIIELISTCKVETQEELADLLRRDGYDVTQATVSRDIRELKLTKVPSKEGKQIYCLLNTNNDHLTDKYVRVLKDGFLSMNPAGHILVVKTISGMAMAVAAAIDGLGLSEVVGCIAGDDTIMVAISTLEDADKVMDYIRHEVLA